MSSDWQKDNKFKSRFNSRWQGSLRKLGALNLESAVVAYEETDPVNIHPKTMPFRDKNSHSFESFRAIGQILQDICRWAIDHEVGKAALDVKWQFVGIVQSAKPKAQEEEIERIKGIGTSDEPEILGATINSDNYRLDARHRKCSAEAQRQMLFNILHHLNAGLQLPLLKTLTDALEALNLGETLPLFEPKKRSRNWTRAYCQLQALDYVEFWRAHDNSNSVSYYRHVWEAFYENPDPDEVAVDEKIRAVRRYRDQAVKYLGIMHVEQRLAMAHNAGTNLKSGEMNEKWSEWTKADYSKERLMEIGRQFRGPKKTKARAG